MLKAIWASVVKTRNLAGLLPSAVQLTAAACIISLQLLLGSPPEAWHVPLSPDSVKGPWLMLLPLRICHCPPAPAEAFPSYSTAQPGLPALPLGMVLQALHSHSSVLLWKISAKHGQHHTSPVLTEGTLGVYFTSAIAAGLNIWAWMSGPAGSSRRGLRMEKATYF